MRKIKEDLETVYENKHSFFMHREVIQNELILYEIRFFSQYPYTTLCFKYIECK